MLSVSLALCLWLATPSDARADSRDDWAAQHRPLRLTALAFQALGSGMLLSAGSLEATLLAQAAHGEPDASYRRMQRAVGPLAGTGSVFTVVSIPLAAAAYERELPDGLDTAVMIVGVLSMVVGTVLWATPGERIAQTQLRQPSHQGGSVLFSAGLPMALWGGGQMFIKALAAAHRP